MALVANFVLVWYANFTGRLPTKGSYLGFSFDSAFVRSVVTQFEYLWILILVNILFTFAFQTGLKGFNNFLSLAIVWMAAAPIAAFLFNFFVTKEKIDAALIIGVLLVIVGGILVQAHKELLGFFTV